MKFRAFKDLFEFAQINARLIVAMVVCSMALIGLKFYTVSDLKECLGVVDLKETTIAFDTPVIVKNIFVLPGQRVVKGQALLEVKPVETTLKLLELKTQLNQLTSEQQIRDSLFNNSATRTSPTDLQIEGLKQQITEMELNLEQAVRFAKEDGIVGSVNFRVSEQVPPFQPVITMNSMQPNLVYGFLHEDRYSDFQIGETLTIQSLNQSSKTSQGKVVSLGRRITEFPERLLGTSQVKFWGREIVVSLPAQNNFLPGEKVKLQSSPNQTRNMINVVEALAGDGDHIMPKVVAFNLPFEASGLSFLPGSDENDLIAVSDDINKQTESPFWRISKLNQDKSIYEPMITDQALRKKEDLESIASIGDRYFALGSMEKKKKHGRIVEFTVDGNFISIKKLIEFKKPLLEAMANITMLKPVMPKIIENLEIESFTLTESSALLALKEPLMGDGSSILFEVENFSEFVSQAGRVKLNLRLIAPIYFSSLDCSGPSNISDIYYSEENFLVLTNCSRQKVSQLWRFHTHKEVSIPELLQTYDIPNLEGLILSSDQKTIYLSDDNGKKGFSTIFQTQIPDHR